MIIIIHRDTERVHEAERVEASRWSGSQEAGEEEVRGRQGREADEGEEMW